MANKTADALARLVQQLPEAQAQQLLEFAEFLHRRYGGPSELPEPENIARPAQESVVKAIKRLAATYPMIDRSKILHETSALMTQHVMQGRNAVEVIDELEVVFRRYYDKLRAAK